MQADEVLLLIGYGQEKALFESAGVELEGEAGRPVYDEATMQTNVPGIYVAGTAIGGTQHKFKVFLENCHVHVGRIVASLKGEVPTNLNQPLPAEVLAAPES